MISRQSKNITSAAIVLGVTSLISRLLGVFRDWILAGQFGAGIELDIYYAAFRLPDLIYNLLVLGALSAGFIPIFTNYLDQPKKAWRLANIVLNLMLIVLLLISVFFFILTPWLTKIIVPGFSQNALDLTSALTRVMLFSPILLGLSGIFAGVLQSFKRFFIYSLAPILYNLGIIVGALLLVPFLGVYGLAWGVVFGSLLHFLIQIFGSWVLGYQYQWLIDLKDRGLRQLVKMMVPRTLGLMINQLNFLLITVIGSTLATGTIAVFNLANNIQSFPLGLFGVSFAIAVFPTLSQLAKKNKEFIETLSLAIRQVLFFVLPASALLIVLRAQIVRIILGSGRFDWEDTILTLETLSLFAFSLFAQSLLLIFIRAFYARLDSKTPFYLGLISTIANIVLAINLGPILGVAGLALAYSLSSILNLVLLMIFLHYQVGWLDGRKLLVSSTKILVATFMLTLVAQAIKYPMEKIFGLTTFLGVASQGIFASLGGIVIYLLVVWLLRSEELSIFVKALKNKLTIKPVVTQDLIKEEKLT